VDGCGTIHLRKAGNGARLRGAQTRGTAGWDRPGALRRHWGRPVVQPRVRGCRFRRFWCKSILAIPVGLLDLLVEPISAKSMSRDPITLRRAADTLDRLRSRRDRVRCTHLDVCFTSMVILALSSEVELSSSTTGDLCVFSTADFGGKCRTGRDRLWPRWSIHWADWGAGGSVEAAPQARTRKSELPRTAWLIPGVFLR